MQLLCFVYTILNYMINLQSSLCELITARFV